MIPSDFEHPHRSAISVRVCRAILAVTVLVRALYVNLRSSVCCDDPRMECHLRMSSNWSLSDELLHADDDISR